MFSLSLEFCNPQKSFPQATQEEKDLLASCEDVDTMLLQLCEMLSTRHAISFEVSGFGQNKWPVDIDFDLVSILMQLPEVINSFEKTEAFFELDFYEQGIQRKLTFKKEDRQLTIDCKSNTCWIPNPSSLQLSTEEFKVQVYRLKENFMKAAERLYPTFIFSNLFQSWCQPIPDKL